MTRLGPLLRPMRKRALARSRIGGVQILQLSRRLSRSSADLKKTLLIADFRQF